MGKVDRVDVAIVGAGTSGLAALREVRKRTEDFVLINAGQYGTTCARVGCMPSKALIAAANAYHARIKLDEFGIRGGALVGRHSGGAAPDTYPTGSLCLRRAEGDGGSWTSQHRGARATDGPNRVVVGEEGSSKLDRSCWRRAPAPSCRGLGVPLAIAF